MKTTKGGKNHSVILFILFAIVAIVLIVALLEIRHAQSSESTFSYREIEHVSKITISFINPDPRVTYTTESDPEKVSAILKYFSEYPRTENRDPGEIYIGNCGVVHIYGDNEDEYAKIVIWGSYIGEEVYSKDGRLIEKGYYVGSEEVDGVVKVVRSLFDLPPIE